MLAVALLSSRPNFPFLLLNCTEAVPSRRRSVGISLIRWELRMVPLPNVLLCWQPQNSRVATILSLGIEHRTADDPVPATMG